MCCGPDLTLTHALFVRQVREAKRLKVIEVTEKEERRHRPTGLNTVELLKVSLCV